jgi:hypothetical protein
VQKFELYGSTGLLYAVTLMRKLAVCLRREPFHRRALPGRGLYTCQQETMCAAVLLRI